MKFKQWAWEVDKSILIGIIFLETIGSLTILRLSYIMSARYSSSNDLIFFFKHLIFVSISFLCIFLFSYISWSKTKKIANWTFIIMLALNFLTLFLGPKVNGVRRWIRLGGFSLQASEFVKTLIVFPVARLLNQNNHKGNMILIAAACLSCLIQPDLGMTFLIITSSIYLVFLNGENFKNYLLIVLITFFGLIISGLFLTKYATNRIMIFLGKKEGFQISQSLQIFSSSKIFGESTTDIYVPDSHCDFMFAEIVSGFGFIAGLIIIFMPVFFSLKVIKKQKKFNREEKLISMGIINQFCIQIYFHILSNLAFAPTKGLNLPFVSFGGSALLAYSISFGCLLCLLKKRIY